MKSGTLKYIYFIDYELTDCVLYFANLEKKGQLFFILHPNSNISQRQFQISKSIETYQFHLLRV